MPLWQKTGSLSFLSRLMEMKVLEILVNLLQNEEEEEDLPEQVSVKNLYWLCQKEIHN